MTDLRIGRIELHGRLPGDDTEARERAGRLLDTACGELLERAFERAGVCDEGELCIRALDVDARLPVDRGDAAMAAAWSLRVAQALRAAVETGGPGVVRYDSIAQALLDVLGSAAQGDFSRAWAWRQLGLWAGGADVRGVAAALISRPEMCAAALRASAARGGLVPLLRALSGDDWAGVARAALVAAGAAPALVDQASPDVPASNAPGGDRVTAPDTSHDDAYQPARLARVRQLASSSPLGLAVARAAAIGLSPVALRALAVLALADADPVALRGPRAARFVAALDEELRARAGAPRSRAGRRADGAPGDAAEAGAARTAADAAAPAGRRPGQHDARALRDSEEALRERGAGAHAPHDSGDAPADAVNAAADGAHDGPPARDEERDRRGHPRDVAEEERAVLDDALADGESEPPIARQRGHTRFGGLLFLLHVVDGLGLPEQWSDAGPLAAWPLRAALHALALALLRDAGQDEVAPDDPAVLAFAGLRPLDPPPRSRQASAAAHATEDDGAGAVRRESGVPEALPDDRQAAIDDAARRIAEALIRRLPADFAAATPPGGSLRGPASPAAQVARLVARRAEVVADPGWIELRLALDEIDTRVRRAGLDLDPGYVPWLGVVVKFRYV